MRKLLSLLVLTTGILGLVSHAAVAQTRIQCPLDEVTRNTVGPVPPGWEVVPSGITDTRVEQTPEGDALQCIYGNGVVVEMLAPRGELCEAREGRFRCVVPRIAAQGTMRVPLVVSINLDNGRQVRRARAADFSAEPRSRREIRLTPHNRARFAPTDVSDPGPRDCRSAEYGNGRLVLTRGAGWTCYITDDGRVGRLRVTRLARRSFDISFRTWE